MPEMALPEWTGYLALICQRPWPVARPREREASYLFLDQSQDFLSKGEVPNSIRTRSAMKLACATPSPSGTITLSKKLGVNVLKATSYPHSTQTRRIRLMAPLGMAVALLYGLSPAAAQEDIQAAVQPEFVIARVPRADIRIVTLARIPPATPRPANATNNLQEPPRLPIRLSPRLKVVLGGGFLLLLLFLFRKPILSALLDNRRSLPALTESSLPPIRERLPHSPRRPLTAVELNKPKIEARRPHQEREQNPMAPPDLLQTQPADLAETDASEIARALKRKKTRPPSRA